MNASMKANAVSPKLTRDALAHKIGVSPDCVDDFGPVVPGTSSETTVRMNAAKNKAHKGPLMILFLSLTAP